MAEKRMYSKKITETDEFLALPLSTQALYFHLGMNADDDGFVSSPMKVMRMIGANKNELDLLLAKKYLIPFESGVVVIRHWRINNYLRSDRYTPTIYCDEKSSLTLLENGSYELKNISGIPVVDQMETQYSIDESSIEKDNIYSDEQAIFDFWNSQNIIKHKELTEEIRKSVTKALKLYSLEKLKVYISRYAKVIRDNRYFFDYKWGLKDLLDRKNGISSFTDDGSKWVDYCNKVGISSSELPQEEKQVKVDNNGVFSI